jgi:hypothetical protein
MKGIPTSAGSASRCESDSLAGGGARRHQVFRGVVGLWRSDRMLAVAREGDLSPLRGWFSWGDGTQRSRAGLSSDGPPGPGPWPGKTRSCQGVSGSNPVLLPEFSIPMPMPIPTRAARGCRAGSLSAGACRFGGFVGWEQCPFATFCDFCGGPPVIEAKEAHAKNRRRAGRWVCPRSGPAAMASQHASFEARPSGRGRSFRGCR